jgi:hypothetical protein
MQHIYDILTLKSCYNYVNTHEGRVSILTLILKCDYEETNLYYMARSDNRLSTICSRFPRSSALIVCIWLRFGTMRNDCVPLFTLRQLKQL